jgi:hypothetical protein
MASFTDAVYDVTKMGNPAPLIYSLSGVNNAIVLSSAGTFNGVDVEGVLYNSTEFTASLSTTQVVTISSPGDTSTIVRLLSGSATGVTLCLQASNNFTTSFTVLTSSSTIIARVSAGGFDNIGPDNRRRWNLNG